ncbi:hypothetical protein NCCP2145_29250 [Pseudarthrobacter sp. NCCP-2145]|nr:hypothetical protein NCCP2145_29250 [Pseudarthrobacter sp. NCCP-2145]
MKDAADGVAGGGDEGAGGSSGPLYSHPASDMARTAATMDIFMRRTGIPPRDMTPSLRVLPRTPRRGLHARSVARPCPVRFATLRGEPEYRSAAMPLWQS